MPTTAPAPVKWRVLRTADGHTIQVAIVRRPAPQPPEET